MAYEGLIAETVVFRGHGGDRGEAYLARPLGAGPFPGVAVIHHMPGWDQWTREVVLKLARMGFEALAPHLYFREGSGSPEEVGARVRAEGGVADAQVIGDLAGAAAFLRDRPTANGKIGVIGFCSGGRHAFLAGCLLDDFDAVVDCWGGNVIVDDPSRLTAKRPVAAIDYVAKLSAPLLGIFGNEDTNPSPGHVERIETALKTLGKSYEFHRFDGAGHGFFTVDRPAYRPEQATEGWARVSDFLRRHLGAGKA